MPIRLAAALALAAFIALVPAAAGRDAVTGGQGRDRCGAGERVSTCP